MKIRLQLKAWIMAIGFLLLTVFTLPAFAADIYVAPDGVDSGSGTSTNPYKTIKYAASRAKAGDIVLVRAGTYVEDNINPPSGTEDAMIVFRPAPGAEGQVIIKYNDAKYANEAAYIAANKTNNNGTDVFNLWNRNYIRIEGLRFEDYKYARITINIKGNGNVVMNCTFKNLGCSPGVAWWWIADGCICGGVTIPIAGGNLNVIRNNHFQSIYGEITTMLGSNSNIILDNTFIGGKGRVDDANSTLGARFGSKCNNVFAYNYCAGSESGRTIWIDVDVTDFIALRNVAYNTYDFMLDESGSERNWAYENIAYNLPISGSGNNARMVGVPAGQFNDFVPQTMGSALCTAFWDTGSTFDAKWVNNVSYNTNSGLAVERTWCHEVRNNIGYEDNNKTGTNTGLKVYECAVTGFHIWHGLDLKGGGPHIFKNNLWYSTRTSNFVHYMGTSMSGTQFVSATTVNNFAVAINSATELGVNPMFVNAAGGDFTLQENSPAKGTGYNGVDRGAYAVYPKTDVGYNKTLPLLADVNLSFSKLFTNVKAGNTVDIEVKLTKPATKAMSFEIAPVAGDARLNADYKFLGSQTITFAVGERTKTISIEVLANPLDEIDQLLALRINPAGATTIAEVGPRNLHLIRIIRATKYSVTLNDIGDAMGRSVIAYYKPGETVTIDAKTRPNYTFKTWNTAVTSTSNKFPVANKNSAVTTLIMPEHNITLWAEWNLVGTRTQATGVTIAPSGTVTVAPGGTTTLTATVTPENTTNKVVVWTSSQPWIAKVDQNGVVTGVSSGSANIKATVLDTHANNHTYVTATRSVSVSPTGIPAGLTMRTDGYYTFKNVNSGRYLGILDDTVAVQGETVHNFDAKTMWKLTESTAPNGIRYYIIRSVADENLVLDVTEGTTGNGTKIGVLEYDATVPAKQQFKFALISPIATNNTFTIRTRALETAGVEVPGSSTEADVELELRTISSTTAKNQQWIAEFHEGNPLITITPGSITFPAAAPGYATTPAARTFTVTNTSTIPNIATGAMTVALGGQNPGSFTLSTTSLASIATVGGTATFTVQPKSGLGVGTHTATVTVSGNGLTAKFATVTFVVALPTDDYYAIKNVNSGRYIEVPTGAGQGANVTQNATAHNSQSNRLWKLNDAGNGYYNIHSKANDALRIDVNGGGTGNGERIIVWGHNSGNNQKFKLVEVSPGIYTIRTGLTNDASCMEVSNASTAEGAQVVQWAVRTSGTTTAIQSQQWILEYQGIPTALQLAGASTIVVYPNPTSGELKINTEGMGNNENIKIFNIMGSLVGTYPCNSPDTTIDISHLIKGVYFLKINGETVKVIKK